jgi:cytoskeletal protein CcmA (bactofilin family)
MATASEKATLIGPETRISGEIRGDEDIVVQGRIEGRVAIGAALSVEDGAIVQADVEARTVTVSGVIVGNVSASDIIRLTSKARVVGDVTAPRVVIEAGAAYRGRLEMGEVTLSASEARSSTTVRRSTDRSTDRASDREATTTVKVPPRMAPPARVGASGPVVARATAAAPPRAASAPARTPPSLPRPETAAAGGVASTPGWAKKKLHRRG